MPRLSPEEVSKVPSVDFMFREDGEFVARSTEELFGGKRVVLFALPGAFTPTCSAYRLPGYEASTICSVNKVSMRFSVSL